jgi:hypothetical protein
MIAQIPHVSTFLNFDAWKDFSTRREESAAGQLRITGEGPARDCRGGRLFTLEVGDQGTFCVHEEDLIKTKLGKQLLHDYHGLENNWCSLLYTLFSW